MHGEPSVPAAGEEPQPPPFEDHHSSNHHHRHHHDIHAAPPPDEPPPSYDDATRSGTAPLLVGPPPNYGSFRAYVDPDTSSIASSEADANERSLPEYIGLLFVLVVFATIVYAFWKVIGGSDNLDRP